MLKKTQLRQIARDFSLAFHESVNSGYNGLCYWNTHNSIFNRVSTWYANYDMVSGNPVKKENVTNGDGMQSALHHFFLWCRSPQKQLINRE